MKTARAALLWLALAASLFVGGKFALARHDAGIRADEQEKAQDAVQVATMAAKERIADSVWRIADSLRDSAMDSARAEKKAAVIDLARLASVPRVRVIEAASPLVPVQWEVPPVAVYVESDSMAYPTHPRIAQIVAFQDTAIHRILIPRVLSLLATQGRLEEVVTLQRNARDSTDAFTQSQGERIQTLERRMAKQKPSTLGKVGRYVTLGAVAYAGYRLGRGR